MPCPRRSGAVSATRTASPPRTPGNTPMLFGDVIAIALSILGFLLSLQGLWLVCQALWPARVEAAAGWCGARGVRCFLLGLPVSFVVILVAAVVAKTFGTFGQLAGFSLALLYVVYANLGT